MDTLNIWNEIKNLKGNTLRTLDRHNRAGYLIHPSDFFGFYAEISISGAFFSR